MGLTWGAGWSPVGAIVGFIVAGLFGAPAGPIVATWIGMFAVLGFLGGTSFSTVLRLAEGRRRFNELSLPRFTAWGAVGGLLLGGFAVFIGLLGPGLSILDAVIVGTATLLGAGSAAGTLALARKSDEPDLLSAPSSRGSLPRPERR
jgi:MFS family permease